jgi:hypothetical protein
MLSLLNELQQKDFVENVYPFGEFHHVVMKDGSGEEKLKEVVASMMGDKMVAEKVKPDIEDCFIELMRN